MIGTAGKVIAACMALASQTHDVPSAVLLGIYKTEGGTVGQQVRNTNGSYDLGPMQINTIWLSELSEHWGVSKDTAHKWVRDDACTNIGVAAWILRGHLKETKSLSQAIAHYHSRTPRHGHRYREKVFSILQDNDLVRMPR